MKLNYCEYAPTIEIESHNPHILMKSNQPLKICHIVLLASSLIAVCQLQAGTLAYWNMDGAGATKTNVNTVGSGVAVTPIGTVNLAAITSVTPVFNPALTVGDNYAGMARSTSTGGGSWTVGTGSSMLNSAYGFSTYFQFTISPTGGQLLNVSSLSFDVVAATTTYTANREFFVESSKTGYGTSSANVLYGAGTQSALNPGGGINWSSVLIPFNDASANTGPYGETLFSVDLSGNSLLQNISDSVTFRFYIGTDTTSQNLGFDNLTVNGSIVPAPEPSVYALAGLSLVLCAGNWRRMSKA